MRKNKEMDKAMALRLGAELQDIFFSSQPPPDGYEYPVTVFPLRIPPHLKSQEISSNITLLQ
jgi:hypothetical protein